VLGETEIRRRGRLLFEQVFWKNLVSAKERLRMKRVRSDFVGITDFDAEEVGGGFGG